MTLRQLRRAAALALAAALMAAPFGLPAPAAAQDGTPPPGAQAASREGLGPAPQRQPRVLERRVLPNGQVATVVEAPASADAYISSERPDENFGAGALFLGYNQTGDAFGAQRVLLRFDLSSIPEDALVENARLRLYLINASPAGDEPMGTVVRRLAAFWGEHAVTWNTEPAWANVRDESSVGTAPGWYEWNITDLTASWVLNDLDNNGVEIIGDENVQQRERAFYSRETNTGFFPRLVITFTELDDQQPPAIAVQDLPPYSGRDFTVSWTGSDPGGSGISHYDVQYRQDDGDWINWQVAVTTTLAEFVGGSDGRTYHFRARGVDNAGNVQSFGPAQAHTLVDTRPPVSALAALPPITSSSAFTVTWSGSDTASGVHFYDVRYRFNGGPWLPWQNQTLAESALFTGAADGVYHFEVRAVDHAGRIEAFTGIPGASTAVDVEAPFVTPRAWLPVFLR